MGHDQFANELEVSAQFLHNGQTPDELSIIFKSTEFRDNDGLSHFIIALKQKESKCFTFGGNFETSEAGIVLLADIDPQSGYKLIAAKDRHITHEFAYVKSCFGYILNPMEW